MHIDFLMERLSHGNFFVNYGEIEFRNGASRYTHFKFEAGGSKVDDSGLLINLKMKSEEFSKEIFWANDKVEIEYQQLNDFNCFIELIVPEKERSRKMLVAPFFNSEHWIEYYNKLLDLNFPSFIEKVNFGKTVIKYRPLKDDFYIGIETDYQSSRKAFKNGFWQTPEYKLVIFKKITSKKIERILQFEKFVHPYFDPPSFDFSVFFAVKTTKQIGENEFLLDDGTKTEFLDDGLVRFYNSNELEDQLKRHAFFYYNILSHTTLEFIRFVEEIVRT
ncbi:hypothetical protein [Chryseobacterium indologenes]|nr:hypothetical protein [Chryseobacterium indologenes]